MVGMSGKRGVRKGVGRECMILGNRGMRIWNMNGGIKRRMMKGMR